MHVFAGMEVEDAHRVIGYVKAVECDQPGGPLHILIQGRDGRRLSVSTGTYVVDGDILRLTVDPQTLGLYDTIVDDPRRTQEIVPTMGELQQQAANLQLGQAGQIVVPVVQEHVVVNKRQVEGGGVRVNKTIDSHEELIEQPLMREEIDVERVAIGQYVDSAPGARNEGDTLIIPVLEEVLIVEKRLLVKEELRITRRQVQDLHRERVTVREEQVAVERLDERAAEA